MSFLPTTPEERESMLRAIGAASVDELFDAVPAEVRLKRPLDLPQAMSEMEVSAHLQALARGNANATEYVSFLGSGCYDHFIPAAVDALAGRSEFYTSYTPYQGEASQGVLQAFYEYQTMICELLGMAVSNASMYDAATALAEAVLMAHAINGRRKVALSQTIHPEYRAVVQTYLRYSGLEVVEVAHEAGLTNLDALEAAANDQLCCVAVQQPNFFGCIEEPDGAASIAKGCGALLLACVDPISLALLKPPGEYNADIAVGNGQPLGGPQCFGGPHFAFMACRQEYVRRMPGRIVGRTVDREGKTAFVLTLQTREQHIRREKATSNICTNHALNALRAAIYLSIMGSDGLREVAGLCVEKSRYARDAICAIDGFEPVFVQPFFREFLVRSPIPFETLNRALSARNIFCGVPVARWYPDLKGSFLVSVTEKRTKEEIDSLAAALSEVAAG